MNALGERSAHAGHLADLVDTGRDQALQPAEMRQQLLPPLGADAVDALQNRRAARTTAPVAMAGDGEAMRLVTNLLDQMESGMIGGETQRLLATGDDQLLEARLALFTLGNADDGDRSQAQFLQPLTCLRDLALSPIDQDQVG